jgi:hypothetical protein
MYVIITLRRRTVHCDVQSTCIARSSYMQYCRNLCCCIYVYSDCAVENAGASNVCKEV